MKRSLRLTFFLPPILLAQAFGVCAQDFYPLEIGNTWNFRVFSNNFPAPSDSGTVQLSVLNDILMPNGKIYRQLDKRDWLDGRWVRADSNFVYYYDTNTAAEVPIYNLRAPVGTVDTVRWRGFFSSRIIATEVNSVFGLLRAVRSYRLDGIVSCDIYLADGFGVIEVLDYADGMWPYQYYWSIRGAVVRDTLYGTVLGLHSEDARAVSFALQQNYPNPFNPSTTIKYELPKSSEVRLSVFDMLGRELSILVNERRNAGVYEVKFDGSSLASGVYVCRLTAGDFVQARRLLLLR